ncbi:MAG: 4Fe-4S dicluster domain-containing protein [Ethanoligenens sp.]|uniref:4Fe-4S dicluster domain-containing protein n=1 Tax=Ethanoligenens sp. TaxID=2099655 RepID=UPI0039E99392
MILFDTDVQELKYKVLREVVRLERMGKLADGYYDIPRTIIPGPKATMRCCIYRERAIVEERVRAAMGDGDTQGIVSVIDSACDECPVQRFSVTDACRGCLAHKCHAACPFDAISYDKHKAVIDPEKCKECGRCMKACPYHAIIEHQRPCVAGCAAKAISIDDQKKAMIDYDRCTSCGTCVAQCPFGAMVDKSFILDVVHLLNEARVNPDVHVYAVLAPAIVTQFSYAKIGQVVAGIRKLGFYRSVEAALGADVVAQKEAQELAEKGFLTSSCCPSFVRYVEVNHPDLVPFISHNVSPMVEAALLIKQSDPGAKVVFIGPCISKKMEIQLPKTQGAIDSVLTFEELQALFDGMDVQVDQLEEDPIDDASCFGRAFARSGGVTQAVRSVVEDEGLDLVLNPEICNGAESYKIALLKASKGKLGKNFIEGMSCVDGCVGGAGCLTHGLRSVAKVDTFSKEASHQHVAESVADAENTFSAEENAGS